VQYVQTNTTSLSFRSSLPSATRRRAICAHTTMRRYEHFFVVTSVYKRLHSFLLMDPRAFFSRSFSSSHTRSVTLGVRVNASKEPTFKGRRVYRKTVRFRFCGSGLRRGCTCGGRGRNTRIKFGLWRPGWRAVRSWERHASAGMRQPPQAPDSRRRMPDLAGHTGVACDVGILIWAIS
jgi:hypothetical protein